MGAEMQKETGAGSGKRTTRKKRRKNLRNNRNKKRKRRKQLQLLKKMNHYFQQNRKKIRWQPFPKVTLIWMILSDFIQTTMKTSQFLTSGRNSTKKITRFGVVITSTTMN